MPRKAAASSRRKFEPEVQADTSGRKLWECRLGVRAGRSGRESRLRVRTESQGWEFRLRIRLEAQGLGVQTGMRARAQLELRRSVTAGVVVVIS